MARKRNSVKTDKVQPSVNSQTTAYLRELVGLGYGNTPTAVAHYLITRGIDDLLRSGLIGPGTKHRVTRQKRRG